jgi:hypothetical protein
MRSGDPADNRGRKARYQSRIALGNGITAPIACER